MPTLPTSHIHPSNTSVASLPSSNMSSSSKPTLQSLEARITAFEARNSAQQTLIEALTERISALETPATSAPKKERKPKKERDPDAPKRPLGAYMRFCQAKRAEAPDAKLKASDLGVMWAALSQAEKDTYKSAAPEAPEAPETPAAPATPATPATPAPATPAEPKKPRKTSPQVRFQQERRLESPDLTAKQLKEEWAALTPDEKKEYESDD